MTKVINILALIAAGAWVGCMAFAAYGAFTGWFFAAVLGIPFLYSIAHLTESR